MNEKKEYGVKLVLNIDEFKAKMQEAQEITKEFSQKVRDNINVDPQLNTQSFTNLKDTMSDLKNILASQLKEMFAGIDKDKIALILSLGYALKKYSDKCKEAKERTEKLKAGLSKIWITIKNVSKELLNRLNQNIDKNIASLKKYALHLFGLQALWRSASKAVHSYMSYDSELSKQISNTWAGLGSFVAPVLEYLVSAFQKLLAYANTVMKVFTGVNFVARANAKAMKQSANATANANKQLANFDEITNLNQNVGGDDKGNNSQIEIPNIDLSKLEEKAEHIKELFTKGEYSQIGLEIGQSITIALKKIPWTDIKNKAGEIGKGFAEFLNGLIDGIDWEVIGNTLAQGINTILEFAYNFAKTFKWKKFGKSIGKALRKAIKSINWKKLAETFTESVSGIFDALYGFIESLDGIEIANAIEELLRNVDWEKIIKKWYKLMGAFNATLTLFIGTFIADAFDGVDDYFKDETTKCGGNIFKGILKGIKDGVVGIGKWIYDNMLTPFLDGFKEVFGIKSFTSPSEVMITYGKNLSKGIISGLKEMPEKAREEFDKFKIAIKDKLDEIKENAKTKSKNIVSDIKKQFENIPEWFKNKFTEAWTNVKNVFSSGGKIFDGIKDGIDRTFKTIVNRLIEGINTIIAKPFNKINSMLNDIRNTTVLDTKPFQSLWNENPLSVPRIPALKIGTDEVYKDGLAYLHAGEKVVPADVAKGYTANNQNTDYLLEVLINKVEELAKTPNILNVNGRELARATYQDFKAEGSRLGSSNVAIRRN